MSTLAFQGFGHDREIGPATRLECKICWTVYDPAEGDPVWQIPPGTSFDRLPPHWHLETRRIDPRFDCGSQRIKVRKRI